MRLQRQVLDKWAADNGYTIEEATRPKRGLLFYLCTVIYVLRSPTVAKADYVITVRDANGHVQKGFARIGGFLGRGENVEVEWEHDQEAE